MDPWAWSVLAGWTADRTMRPPGPLFCVIDGPTRGRAWSATAVFAGLRHPRLRAGVRRRSRPTNSATRTPSSSCTRASPLPLIQRQLGHAYLSTTGTYLEGISSEEIIGAEHGRKAAMMHAGTGLHPLPSANSAGSAVGKRPVDCRSCAEARVSRLRHALTSGQKLAKSTRESWSFGTNPRAPCACAIA
jgi:hypothetical protein